MLRTEHRTPQLAIWSTSILHPLFFKLNFRKLKVANELIFSLVYVCTCTKFRLERYAPDKVGRKDGMLYAPSYIHTSNELYCYGKVSLLDKWTDNRTRVQNNQFSPGLRAEEVLAIIDKSPGNQYTHTRMQTRLGTQARSDIDKLLMNKHSLAFFCCCDKG